ncbi:hypothetical protein [Marivivens marinus]|uniref:hypothetical protein n=1 Tax=Marivivens marinus TaxID=3110173 RepID=UPI003B849026
MKWTGILGSLSLFLLMAKCINPYHERTFEPSYLGGGSIGYSLWFSETIVLSDRFLFDRVEIGSPFNLEVLMLDNGVGRSEIRRIDIKFLDQYGAVITVLSWETSMNSTNVAHQTHPYPDERFYFEGFEMPEDPVRIELELHSCSGEATCEPMSQEFEISIVERRYFGSFILERLMSV